MFKGLKALFASGLILHPMVLTGIAMGIFFSVKFEPGVLFSVFSDYGYYLVAAVIAALYVLFFQRTYNGYDGQTDWKATAAKVPGAWIKLMLSNILTVVFLIILFF